MAQKSRAEIRAGVHSRIRKKVRGTAERPRLAVFRSVNHIYAQVIDDKSGRTLATASTTEKGLGLKTGGNVEAAKAVGKAVAERAITAGVSSVVFDRGGYLYHGRVKALIDATREAGLNKNEQAAEASAE
jgi:large subunit ribosomal protein L18